jgi:very-short-patch-repair endonuclease/predicted transcriptional regulator of viral defense system
VSRFRGASELEERVLALVVRQHGVVSRRQLIKAGMTSEGIRWRIQSGRFAPVHQGVYRVGPLELPLANEIAAVLACGPSAVLSHGSAAVPWELSRGDGLANRVHVSVIGAHRGRLGVRIHRVHHLPANEITTFEGIPITTPARTILDLAGEVGLGELERMVAGALNRRIASVRELRDLVARHPTRRGAGRLQRLCDADSGPALTRSEAERLFLDLVRRAGLPLPTVNARLAGLEVDFFWPAHRLIVEVDGFAFHASRSSFESDRRRDAKLVGDGFRVMRVTWRQIVERPELVLVSVTRALLVGEAANL